MKNGRGWGQDATLLPGTKRIGQAARRAVSDPKTWVPVAGTALFGFTGLDREVSEWAYENTPVFGSIENALEWSDALERCSLIIGVSTTLITPSGNNLPEIAFAKFKGIAIEALAVAFTGETTAILKKASKRNRPNEIDDESFPSGHASSAFVFSSLAVKNLDVVSINNRVKNALDIGIFAMASGTAWARVEGKAHFPSDVFFSMALGNFMAVFFTEAFMGYDKEAPLKANIIHSGDETVLRFRLQF